MSSLFLGAAARDVLARYPVASHAAPAPLGNCGGFSGARLWRVRTQAGDLCLRAWPPSNPSPERLLSIQHLMKTARDAGLDVVPTVHTTHAGRTWTERAGRLWELTTWMPGCADFHDHPRPARLEAACTALAQLHLAWSAGISPSGPCPGVLRRLEKVRRWSTLLQSGWRPRFHEAERDPVTSWAERAWHCLGPRVTDVPHRLAPWLTRPVPLQPCLCDIWHDHVLFTGDRVTGLVDFGAIKLDHVAVDLARLLGSLIGDDAQQRSAGIQAYRRVKPLSADEEALVGVLDETGTVLAAANWLMWLYRDEKTFEDRAAVARRLAELVARIER